jgi:hypothetical protein
MDVTPDEIFEKGMRTLARQFFVFDDRFHYISSRKPLKNGCRTLPSADLAVSDFGRE